MLTLFTHINSFVWGPPLLALLVGTGIYLSFRLGFVQLRQLSRAFKLIFREDNGQGDISSYAALATALAATVGTGNIVGVATAIKSGGPMYYIVNGMGQKWKPLAVFFSAAGILVALLGIGTFTQVNAIASSLEHTFKISTRFTSLILAVIVLFIIFGGIKSISKVSEKIVPFMAISYILATLIIIAVNYNKIPHTFQLIFSGAFSGTAAIGGFSGAIVKEAIQKGIARGVFSNESGLGSAPIAAAAAKTKEPVEQGLISMTGTFIDTIVICTLTGIAILVTGKWLEFDLQGAPLTQASFNTVFGSLGSFALTFCLVLFAFTTILGWSYYGERCFEYLFGTKFINAYRIIFVIMVGLGGFLQLDLIWVIADIVNGLMALPNLIALLVLSPIIVKETQKYFSETKNITKP
ncbi:TPA: sodium:alanine symporter family protein [Streptococcus agalactiae]|nr:sodium:alanine symporter family protein [Streptococcus agalactiae]